jgi:hypothetical protein
MESDHENACTPDHQWIAVVITGAAKADDHLFQATHNTHTQAGLTEQSTGFLHGDLGKGQGSPFTGEHTGGMTPSSDPGALHANPGPNGSATSANGHTSDHTAH